MVAINSPEAMATTELAGFNSLDFRRCLGEFVTGIVVITTIGRDGKEYGVTANSFSSVSLDPPLVLWSMQLNASTFPIYSEADFFGINILAEDQVDISNRFAKSGPDRFEGVPTTPSTTGVPLIDGSVAQLECRRETNYPGGDHVVFICRVQRMRTSQRKPLAFRSGKYATVFTHEVSSFGDAGQGNIATLNAVHAARPAIEELGRAADRTVALTLWGNYGPTLIWWWEARKPLATNLRCGRVMSMLGSSSGPLFAAYLPSELTDKLIHAELAQAAELGEEITTRAALEDLLLEVKATQTGSLINAKSSVDSGRTMNAFSCPVFNSTGDMMLAFTMMGGSEDLLVGDSSIAVMRRSAEAFSRKLGYAGSY